MYRRIKYLFTGKTEINCYPNPFSDETTIEINLIENAEVQIEIFNQLGQGIKTLSNKQPLSAGYHRFNWDGRNYKNNKVPAGVYFLGFTTENSQQYRKIILSGR